MKRYSQISILILTSLIINLIWYSVVKNVRATGVRNVKIQNFNYTYLENENNLKEKLIYLSYSDKLKMQIRNLLILEKISVNEKDKIYIGFYSNKEFCETCLLPIVQDLNSFRIENNYQEIFYFSNSIKNIRNFDTNNSKYPAIALGDIPYLKDNNINVLIFTFDSNFRVGDLYCPEFFPVFMQVYFQNLKLKISAN